MHDEKPHNYFSESFVKEMCSLSEEFLRVVTAMVTERTNSNIGEAVSLTDELQNRVVQMLCSTEAPTHSAIGVVVKSSTAAGRADIEWSMIFT